LADTEHSKGETLAERQIPEPTEALKSLCNAENQFSNFEQVFRKVLSVPKAEVIKRETKERRRTARKRAKKQKG